MTAQAEKWLKWEKNQRKSNLHLIFETRRRDVSIQGWNWYSKPFATWRHHHDAALPTSSHLNWHHVRMLHIEYTMYICTVRHTVIEKSDRQITKTTTSALKINNNNNNSHVLYTLTLTFNGIFLHIVFHTFVIRTSRRCFDVINRDVSVAPKTPVTTPPSVPIDISAIISGRKTFESVPHSGSVWSVSVW